MKRRAFLKTTGILGAGMLIAPLGIDLAPVKALAEKITKAAALKIASISTSVCAYCSVGCGLLCATDKTTGKLLNVEGDPEHPINEGTLCAKGAGTYQTSIANQHRLTKVLYRKPYGTQWEEKSWDFALDRITQLIKKERDASFITKNEKGQTVNRVETIAHMGSSNIDNEECWSVVAFARSLGLVYLDHQARV